jgi:hypothetical protein
LRNGRAPDGQAKHTGKRPYSSCWSRPSCNSDGHRTLI